MKKYLENFPKLSIIIVNYNAGEVFQQCVKSVIETTRKLKAPQCELILIDNASTDNSFAKTPQDKNIVKLQNKENVGFAKAVNQGIKKAKSEYILLLNPDTVVKNGAIMKLFEFAQKTLDCGAVGPKLLNPDHSIQASAFKLPTLLGATGEFWLGHHGAYSKYIPKKGSVESLVMAAFLITPRAFKKVGILNEKYFMYFEDLDYCRSIKKAGLKVYYLPESEVVHHHGISGKNLLDEKNQWRRLIPSSKIYHGIFTHYAISVILWTSHKWQVLLDDQLKRFAFLLLLTPFFWWSIFGVTKTVNNWKNTHTYFNHKITSIYSEEKLQNIAEFRSNTYKDSKQILLSRLLYNKATFLVDEGFSYLSFFSPRLYFQSGDGTPISPPGVEPLPIILFPFWVWGIIETIKVRKYKVFYLVGSLAMVAFMSGRREFSFLFPVSLTYLYLASTGIGKLKSNKFKSVFCLFLIIYCVFIIGRALWITTK